MVTQAVKVKSAETETNVMTGAASGVAGTVENTREFLSDVRVEMKKVTWPTKDDVVSTTGVVIGTVAFFGLFLSIVDWLVQHGVERLFRLFGV